MTMSDYSSEFLEKVLERELDPSYKRRAKIILENISFDNRRGKILDIGCGRGFYAQAINIMWPEAQYVGIEANIEYLNQAKKGKYNKGFQFIHNNTTDLPFGRNAFDYVICSEVLEHVDDDLRLLREIRRVLKPGGIALISVPNKNYPFNLDPLNWILERVSGRHIPSNIWWLAGIWADHKRLYSPIQIRNVISKSKLKIEKYWNSTHHSWLFSHFFLYGIGKNLVTLGLAKNFDRFNNQAKPGVAFDLLKKWIYWLDQGNNNVSWNDQTSTVNIIVKAVSEKS